LLAQGYALAGSAYRSNGWAVAEGVAAGEQLHEWFVDTIGRPDRVYLWGDSLGGLITQTLAEKHPEWVTGAAALCGVLGGLNLNLDLALDAAYALKTLLYPALQLTGFASHAEAVRNWQGAYRAVSEAGADLADGVPKLLVVAAIADAPTQTQTYDGSTPESKVRAYAEAVLTALGYGTFGRYEIEQRVGGNPSTNVGARYAPRISAAERALAEAVSPGSVARNVALLERGRRVAADAAARAEADTLGKPTGDIQDPTLTLHTAADPLVLVANETVFAARVAESEDRTADLVQYYTVAPPTYPQQPGAPFGAGHCNFTDDTRIGVITLLDQWARTGRYPAPAAAEAAFGPQAGLSPAYAPPPWPAEAR
jgi:pimeloyl-ACP methyl ester carboxylesterase